jgi:hypothetical protein
LSEVPNVSFGFVYINAVMNGYGIAAHKLNYFIGHFEKTVLPDFIFLQTQR